MSTDIVMHPWPHVTSCGGRCPGTVGQVLAAVAGPSVVSQIRAWDDPLSLEQLNDPACRILVSRQLTDMVEMAGVEGATAIWIRYYRVMNRLLGFSVGEER